MLYTTPSSHSTLARLHQKVGTYTRCAFHCAINIILVMMMPSSGLFVGNTRGEPHRTRYYSLWQDSEAGARRGIISMINFLVIFCKMEFSLHIKYWCPESSSPAPRGDGDHYASTFYSTLTTNTSIHVYNRWYQEIMKE